MKSLGTLLLSLGLAAAAHAQTAVQPAVRAGDTWTYRITTENAKSGWNQIREAIAVTRVTSSLIYVTAHRVGSTQPPKEAFQNLDWARLRDVNGQETVVNRPLAFPLAAGKTWELHYTEQHPNKAFKSEQIAQTYRVVAIEPIEVPAGTFTAFKIEAEGHWTAELEPQSIVQSAETSGAATALATQAQKARVEPATGRLYKAFWYVPEIKRWVKSVEENYANGGVLNERTTLELESFKLAD